MSNSEHFIDREKLGPPGFPGVFIMLDIRDGDTRSDESRLKDNSERDFEITCSISKHHKFSDDISASVDKGSGGSFFLSPENVEEVRIVADGETFTFQKNQNNELSAISYKCVTKNLNEARSKFLTKITPFLDHLCYVANTPLDIDKIYSMDKKNNSMAINFFTPYPSLIMNTQQGALFREMIPVYALYREAKNSLSSYYRFLCYYKILEGIYKYLRPKLMKKAATQNIKIATTKEIVQQHDELQRFHNKYIGKPVKDLFDNELRTEFRDTVAHFMLNDDAILNVSDYYTDARFSNILLVAELCCREVIDRQNDYYKQFYTQDGKK